MTNYIPMRHFIPKMTRKIYDKKSDEIFLRLYRRLYTFQSL